MLHSRFLTVWGREVLGMVELLMVKYVDGNVGWRGLKGKKNQQSTSSGLKAYLEGMFSDQLFVTASFWVIKARNT